MSNRDVYSQFLENGSTMTVNLPNKDTNQGVFQNQIIKQASIINDKLLKYHKKAARRESIDEQQVTVTMGTEIKASAVDHENIDQHAAGDVKNLNNFKGYHQNNDKQKILEASFCPRTGAHFKHPEMYGKLMRIIQNRLQEKRIEKLTGEEIVLDPIYFSNEPIMPEIPMNKLKLHAQTLGPPTQRAQSISPRTQQKIIKNDNQKLLKMTSKRQPPGESKPLQFQTSSNHRASSLGSYGGKNFMNDTLNKIVNITKIHKPKLKSNREEKGQQYQPQQIINQNITINYFADNGGGMNGGLEPEQLANQIASARKHNIDQMMAYTQYDKSPRKQTLIPKIKQIHITTDNVMTNQTMYSRGINMPDLDRPFKTNRHQSIGENFICPVGSLPQLGGVGYPMTTTARNQNEMARQLNQQYKYHDREYRSKTQLDYMNTKFGEIDQKPMKKANIKQIIDDSIQNPRTRNQTIAPHQSQECIHPSERSQEEFTLGSARTLQRQPVLSRVSQQGSKHKTIYSSLNSQQPQNQNHTDIYKQQIYKRMQQTSVIVGGDNLNLHDNIMKGNVPMHERVLGAAPKKVSHHKQSKSSVSSAMKSQRAKSQLGMQTPSINQQLNRDIAVAGISDQFSQAKILQTQHFEDMGKRMKSYQMKKVTQFQSGLSLRQPQNIGMLRSSRRAPSMKKPTFSDQINSQIQQNLRNNINLPQLDKSQIKFKNIVIQSKPRIINESPVQNERILRSKGINPIRPSLAIQNLNKQILS